LAQAIRRLGIARQQAASHIQLPQICLKMTEQGWVCAGKLSDLQEGEGVRVQLPSGRKKDAIALFKHRGQLYALEDRCCHADKSLHGGDLEDLGKCVVGRHGEEGIGGLCVQCPRHQRKFAGGLYFSLETGRACTPEYTSKFRKLDKHHVRVHDVRVESGFVYVSVNPRRSSKAKQAVVLEVSSSSETEQGLPDGAVPQMHEKRDPKDKERLSWRCRLERLQRVSHDTLVFCLHHPVGEELPPAPVSPVWHITLQAVIGGRVVDRDYTPVSTWFEWRDERTLRLLIKIYPTGLMTQHLAGLRLNDVVHISAPTATLMVPSLLPPGQVTSSRGRPEHVVLFAAGTGIVPMVQLLAVALQGSLGVRTVTLLFGSRSPADLLCWEELRSLRARASADELAPELRVWLAFSGGGAGPELHGAALAGVVRRRLDASVVSEALTHLPAGSPFHAVCSGPNGFFDGMREACRAARVSGAASFVNLDE